MIDLTIGGENYKVKPKVSNITTRGPITMVTQSTHTIVSWPYIAAIIKDINISRYI